MKDKRIYVGLILLGLLIVSMGVALAQGPDDRPEPQSPAAVEATLGNEITYHGLLRENGHLVDGTRDMVFQLFTDSSCSTSADMARPMPGVVVRDGLFDVNLAVYPSAFNGQALWLRIQVADTEIGCEKIVAAPYALSLRPGASIIGEVNGWDAIQVMNTSTSGLSTGIFGLSNSTSGKGIFGYAAAESGQNYGIYGQSKSGDGAGVYAKGVDAGADLILAGNADTGLGDDGVLSSDPDLSSSDLIFLSNDGIRIELDNDGDGEDADLEVRDKDGNLIFNIDESGAVTFGGAGLAAFPRPAYDSGWLTFSLGEDRVLTHSLGGNTDNYVVDLICRRSGGYGVNNFGVGGDANSPDYYGAWWSNLSTTTVSLHRWDQDSDCPNLRLRIWMYP